MTQAHDTTTTPRRATHLHDQVGTPRELWRLEHCRIDEYKARIKDCEQKMSALADKPCAPPHVGTFYDLACTKVVAKDLIRQEQERLTLWLMLDEMDELARQGFEAWEAGYKGTEAFKQKYPNLRPEADYLLESFDLYRATLLAADDKHVDVWDFLGPEIEDYLLPMKKYNFKFPPCPTCGRAMELQGIFCKKDDTPDQQVYLEVYPRCASECSHGYAFERLNGYRLEAGQLDQV